MQKESVRAFKNELRNYAYYLSRITSLENSIELCYERLGGIRGVDPSKEPLHIHPNDEYQWKLRDDIELYEAKIKRLQDKVDEIDLILSRMETDAREALIDIYVHGKQVRSVAMRLYLSHSGLLKRLNKAIEDALE